MSGDARMHRRSVVRAAPCLHCKYHAVCSATSMACVNFARFAGAMTRDLQRYRHYPSMPRREIHDSIFSEVDHD